MFNKKPSQWVRRKNCDGYGSTKSASWIGKSDFGESKSISTYESVKIWKFRKKKRIGIGMYFKILKIPKYIKGSSLNYI